MTTGIPEPTRILTPEEVARIAASWTGQAQAELVASHEAIRAELDAAKKALANIAIAQWPGAGGSLEYAHNVLAGLDVTPQEPWKCPRCGGRWVADTQAGHHACVAPQEETP